MTDYRQNIDQYLTRYEHPQSIRIKRRILTHFVQKSGVERFCDVLESHLTDYRQYLETSHSNSMARTYVESLKHFFKWLATTGQIFADPAKDLVLPKPMPRSRPIPSQTDMDNLFATLDWSTFVGIRNQAIFSLITTCGPRRLELMDLTISDVDLTGLTLRISGQKARVIPLWQKTADALLAYIKEARPQMIKNQDQTELWISHRTGRGLSLVRLDQLIREQGKKAKIRPGYAFLRRAGMVYMLENGLSPEQLPAMLGYAGLKSMSKSGIKISQMRKIKKESSHA